MIRARLPKEPRVATGLDLDLQLVSPDGPGTVRGPDILVAAEEARLRVRREGGVLTDELSAVAA